MAKEKQTKKAKTHVSEKKKKIVQDLVELMKHNTVMIVSVKSLPGAQFQNLKKSLREKAKILFSKKSLIKFALEHAANDELKKLEDAMGANCVLLFSEQDAFELSAFLSENKIPAKAREGQIAIEDIEIKAGPTELMPGPDISALSIVGLKPKVENGKIAIMQDHVVVKKGEVINSNVAAILAKLDITPFEIGLEPVAAFTGGKVYHNIKVNKKETLETLMELYSRSLAFSVSLNFVNKDSLPFILGKAVSHENALNSFIKEDAPSENKSESQPLEKVDQNTEMGGNEKKDSGEEESAEVKPEEEKENDVQEAKPKGEAS